MSKLSFAGLCRLGTAGALLVLLALSAGCSGLSATATPQPSFYSLDSALIDARATSGAPATAANSLPTLIVNPPHAVSGFDSQRIIYVREAHKLEYFAHSEWVDTPARMIAPLIITAVESTGQFRAAVLTPSAVSGDLRLDTEIMRLQHDFNSVPSRVRFTLRAYIIDNTTRKMVAWREFDESATAVSENPYGGVVAANRVVRTVLEQLASFCGITAENWRAAAAGR